MAFAETSASGLNFVVNDLRTVGSWQIANPKCKKAHAREDGL